MTQRPSNRTPLRSRPIVWVAAALVVAVLAGGGYGLWYLFLKPSGPPPVSISNVLPTTAPTVAAASPASVGAASATPANASAPAASSAAASSGGTTAGLDGTWKVDQSLGSFSDFSDSFVGYRVQEKLSSIGANTAVGRTPDVTGSITLAGTTVTAAEFTADLTTLKSDDDRRDGQLNHQGIQTSQFPNATFKLTQPIDLGSVPADAKAISVTATGDFTLHGVTKSVQIPMQAKLSGSTIVVTGSLPIVFADYSITPPNSFAVLSIEDHGTMEFQLLFTKG